MKPTRASLLLVVSLTLGLASCEQAPADDPESLTIGLLLPFTGADSASARNFERAALFARDQVNLGGGVKGHDLRIVSADTHSDPNRAKESAEKLVRAGARLIIGPESAEISDALRPLLEERQVSFMSPLVGAADPRNIDCSTPWFRLAPSSWVLGESLAKKAIANDEEHVALLHSDGDYDVALSQAFHERFEALGGTVVFEATLPRQAESYSTLINRALDEEPEAILLAASPRSASLAVNELGVLSRERPDWYLSPLLKTEVFLENVEPEILQGALGVSPKIFDEGDDFPNRFSERWQGDTPLDGAYFYYDAVALSAFALGAVETNDGTFSVDALNASLGEKAGPPGEATRWNELSESMPRLTEGDPIYYTGLTGPLLLRDCGDRRSGATSTWRVIDGAIVVDDE